MRFCLAIMAFFLLPGQSLLAASFANHLAVYDVHLKRADASSGIADISGRMVMELSGSACEGWLVGFRMVNRYVGSEEGDPVHQIDLQSTSWESGDGREMEYTERALVNNEPDHDVHFSAVRQGEAGPIFVEGGPDAARVELPGEVIFPMAHQARLLEAAKAGHKVDQSLVYDGSDGFQYFKVVTFIGAPETGIAGPGQEGQALKAMRSWSMVISYYDSEKPNEGEALPLHQIMMRIYENGIAGDLTLDYGDLEMAGKFTQVELSPASANCP